MLCFILPLSHSSVLYLIPVQSRYNFGCFVSLIKLICLQAGQSGLNPQVQKRLDDLEKENKDLRKSKWEPYCNVHV